MADIKQLIADPDFSSMNPNQQREALNRFDPEIGSLSDYDYDQLVSRVKQSLGHPAQQSHPSFLGGLAGTLASPITGLASIPGQIYDYFTKPYHPSGGFLSEEPVTQAYGNALAAIGSDPFSRGPVNATDLGKRLSSLNPETTGTPATLKDLAPNFTIPLPSGQTALQALRFIRHPIRQSMKVGADYLIKSLDERLNPTEEIGPFRPTPSIKQKTAFGGSIEPLQSQTNPMPPSRGYQAFRDNLYIPPEAETITPVAPKPFKANPAVKQRLKFGGSIQPEPSYTNPAQPRRMAQPKAPAEPTPQAQPTPAKANGPIEPIEGPAIMMNTEEGLKPVDRVEMNRMLHAKIQRLDIPGSPAGKKAPGSLSTIAQKQYGVAWDQMTIQQMKHLYENMESIAAKQLAK